MAHSIAFSFVEHPSWSIVFIILVCEVHSEPSCRPRYCAPPCVWQMKTGASNVVVGLEVPVVVVVGVVVVVAVLVAVVDVPVVVAVVLVPVVVGVELVVAVVVAVELVVGEVVVVGVVVCVEDAVVVVVGVDVGDDVADDVADDVNDDVAELVAVDVTEEVADDVTVVVCVVRSQPSNVPAWCATMARFSTPATAEQLDACCKKPPKPHSSVKFGVSVPIKTPSTISCNAARVSVQASSSFKKTCPLYAWHVMPTAAPAHCPATVFNNSLCALHCASASTPR